MFVYMSANRGDVKVVMSVIYGVGNAVREETCNLNMLILSAATQGM